MVLIGCKPEGRHTEQHDIFFGIAQTLADLVPQLKSFWPGKHKLHIDAWREVTTVGQFNIRIVPAKKKKSEKIWLFRNTTDQDILFSYCSHPRGVFTRV